MRAAGDPAGVPLMIERQESIEHLGTGGWADSPPHALRGLVESVIKVDVVPAVCRSDSFIEMDRRQAEIVDGAIGPTRVIQKGCRS